MATANDCPKALTACKDVLQKCDAALESRKEQVRICDLALQQQFRLADDLRLEIQDRDEQLQSMWRNPWFTGSLGVALGAVLVGLVGGR